jgi:hypothetical protein
MDFAKVMEALGACEDLIRKDPVYVVVARCDSQMNRHNGLGTRQEHLGHCLDMMRRMRTWEPEQLEKAFRWLGFIQGVLYAHGVTDIETMKKMNRSEPTASPTSSASSASAPMKCDRCDTPATLTCNCRRCASEPEDSEMFHTCAIHREEADAAHERMRGRVTAWVPR